MKMLRVLPALVVVLLSASGIVAQENLARAGTLGVSYPAWSPDGFAAADVYLEQAKTAGFRSIAFVPTYTYSGFNIVDLSKGPKWTDYEKALETALSRGFAVVLKPHLDPKKYQPGFDQAASSDHSWRVGCPWRGYFDIDPMNEDYREKVIGTHLQMIAAVLHRLDAKGVKSAGDIRLDLGAELMNSMVYQPQQWVALAAWARKESRRLGIEDRVMLSHNFSHHFEIPDDFVLRMDSEKREELARYIKSLDALAVSQYMDLTAALTDEERVRRLPTAQEVAKALLMHEQNLRRDILEGLLGLKADEVPQLHLGEFGVGRGGLRHPNLWEGAVTAEEQQALQHEIALGHEGLGLYMRQDNGRRAQSAILWVTGRFYDIFGWMNPFDAIPEAARAYSK
ncbi:MAG: hypothetical protein AABZ44_05275 [Elusimicrobiota bacterium]